jgi:hypothetical protein
MMEIVNQRMLLLKSTLSCRAFGQYFSSSTGIKGKKRYEDEQGKKRTYGDELPQNTSCKIA